VREVSFFPALFTEFAARRRRLRKALGDRGQGLFELFVIGGLLLGSAGLFLYPWMIGAAAWGFAIPPLFLGLYLVLDARRQKALAAAADPDAVRKRADLAALGATLACVLAGYGAFALGIMSDPRPRPEAPGWQPPPDAVDVQLHPGG